MSDADVCHCGCHPPRFALVHCFPCCSRCPHCSQDIVIAKYEKHAKDCLAGKQAANVNPGLAATAAILVLDNI